MKIELNINSNMDGINFVTLAKNFRGSVPESAGFPKTSTEAIEMIIIELQEMIKKEEVKQCYTCNDYNLPSGNCKVLDIFKESHDTCPAWKRIEKCCTCHNYHKPTSICQVYSETEDENAKVDPEFVCPNDWTPIIPMEKK